MVTVGSEILVWFGLHCGAEGKLASVARRAGEAVVYASLICRTGEVIRVPAYYCDPNPGLLSSKERAA